MPTFSQYGKISAQLLDRLVFPYLGAKRSDVLVGPGHGLDNAVIDLGGNQVLIVTTDVLWCEPRFGLEDAAWGAWQIAGSDITTCGHPPAYIVVDFTLPFGSKEDDFETICKVFHREAVKYGASVVAGHSSPYFTSNYPTIGTITMMTTCSRDAYITPQMAQPGDVLILTKGVSIGSATCMARFFPNTVKKELGADVFDEAWQMFYQCSSMEDALVASSIGLREQGVTAMHDITEGGIMNAFLELSIAGKAGLWINLDEVFIPPAAKAVCDFFNIDPFRALSLGTLLMAVKPNKAEAVIGALKSHSINAFVVGEVRTKDQGVLVQTGGKAQYLEVPGQDSLWPALFMCIEKGLA